MDVPWSRIALNRLHPSMELAGAEFNETEGEKLALTFNPAHADKLFDGFGPHFPGTCGAGERSQAVAAFSADRFHQGQSESEKEGGRVGESLWPGCRETIRS